MGNAKEHISLDQLHVLLSKTTSEFIKMVEEHKDSISIKNKGREIELIQIQIEKYKELKKEG